MRGFLVRACLAAALLLATAGALAAERQLTSQPAMWFGGTEAKATGDTIDLMGPGGIYPYRGDFETGSSRPGGSGLLPDGWYSVDETAPANHWKVEDFIGMSAPYAPLSGTRSAWVGDRGFASCGGTDVAGGYGNNWRDILEFRRTVSVASHTVRVQGNMRYDSEPGYDFTTLQRRTAGQPNFEPISGSGLSWDGTGTVAIDYTFNYTAAELLNGNEIAVAFIFDSDGAWSDSDCLWGTSGGATLDDLVVTVDATVYSENFEDGLLGPDWVATPNVGVGDFARVWSLLGDADECASNYSRLVAFIDDGLVVPGTGGTVGGPGNDYGPPGGYIVNNTGGLLGPTYHLQNSIYSPIMTWPDPAMGGITLEFDVYRHELLVANDSPGIFYTWEVWSLYDGPWFGDPPSPFLYYGGPNYLRWSQPVGHLVDSQAPFFQVGFGVYELGWQFGYGNGTNGTPAPYFDNVRVKVYPIAGPNIAVTELRLANDGFPAIGDIDLANLGANSVRFDMAANISARSHLRNDPGDSIWIDVTPRMGGTLSTPVMHWTFARRNPLFDPYRTLPANPVAGNLTRTATGAIVANRYNFDLPDTGMIFPGDVLHYYFAATDNVAGNIGTAYAPLDRSGFGNPAPLAYPSVYSVSGLPTILDAAGTQPQLLFWNDFGFRGGEDEWLGALRYLGYARGVDYDIFNTHAPSSGVGNGLGGRATVDQVAGYTDIIYSCGDLGSFTLSNGDFAADPGNDLALLNGWLAPGGRDLFLSGDDLAASLAGSGSVAQAFLAARMGLAFNDGDVRDNIFGQTAPLVLKVPGNPVFTTAADWVAYGGCFGINDFDAVTPLAGATRLAQFTAPDGVATPYTYAAATLMTSGTNRVVSMNCDLSFIVDPRKSPAPPARRTLLLSNVLDYFGVANNPGGPISGVGSLPPALAVVCAPNPFNPALTLRYGLRRPGPVTVRVFDVRGALVRTLLDGLVAEASGSVTWDGADDGGRQAGSGLYFVETRADGQVDVRKVTMLK